MNTTTMKRYDMMIHSGKWVYIKSNPDDRIDKLLDVIE